MKLTVFALAAAVTCFPGSPPSAHGEAAAPLPYAANDLYAARSRRRMASYLRLRLMELRSAEFRRVERVIRGELSLDDLLQEGSPGEGPGSPRAK